MISVNNCYYHSFVLLESLSELVPNKRVYIELSS
jgi:hypothetical protein